jgi:hypothetical protein
VKAKKGAQAVSKLLKGNYQLSGGPGKSEPVGNEPTASEEFERRALERLGGSIAFVMKRNTFVWSGEKTTDDPDRRKG